MVEEYRSFRQRVRSPTTSSLTHEVVSPTSSVSSTTLIIMSVRRSPRSKISFFVENNCQSDNWQFTS